MKRRRTRLAPWLSAGLGLCILAAGVYWVGPRTVLAALADQEPLAVLLAVAAIACGTLLGAWNAFALAGLASWVSFSTFVPVYWRAWAIGLTLPGQVGDLLSTLWQLRGRVDTDFVAGRLLVDKAVTLGCMFMLLACLPAVLGVLAFPLFLLPPLAMAIVLAVALVVLRRLASSQHWPSHRLALRLQPIARASSVRWSALALNAAVSTAKILLTGLAYWLLLPRHGGGTAGFPTVLAISQTAGLVAYLPISFNGLGTVELSAVQLFGMVGYSAPKVLSVYLVLRLCALATAWIPASMMSFGESRAARAGEDFHR